MINKSNNAFINCYQRFTDFLYQAVLLFCKMLFVIMVVSVSVAVAGRFLFKSTPSWSEEVGILCLVWLCFLTASMAIRDGLHIRMTITEYLFPPALCKFLHFFSYLVLLLLGIALTYFGFHAMMLTASTRLPATQVSSAFVYGAVCVSSVISIFMSVSRILKGGW